MSVRLRTRNDGSPYWQVRFRENGKESSISWDTPADADQFDTLVKKVGAAKAREICRIIELPSRATTLRQFLEKHNDRLTGVERGTLNRYRAYLKNGMGPFLGDIPLTALNRDDIARWINAMAAPDADGNSVSGKTIANKHGYLAGALNVAVTAGHIKSNLCEGNRLPAVGPRGHDVPRARGVPIT